MQAEDVVAKTADTALKIAETAVKEIWSLLDAASQKESPSQYLSPQAIGSVQGRGQ